MVTPCNVARALAELTVEAWAMFCESEVPKSYKAAMESKEKLQWKKSMDAEIASLKANDTFILVARPKNCKLVGTKWVFTKKLKADGSLDKYKARLVAKRYSQTPGIDFNATYSPVASRAAIRLLINIPASNEWDIYQLDVKTAFLNGTLEEDIYMAQPEGYEDAEHSNKICKLLKGIYGLKQASR